MPDKVVNYKQTAPATLNIQATIGDADLGPHETTPFTVEVRNTGGAALVPITVGCDLAAADPGISLFGPTAGKPVPIAPAVPPPAALNPEEVRRAHWVVYWDPTVAAAAAANPPFTIAITVVDPLFGSQVHNFVCPA